MFLFFFLLFFNIFTISAEKSIISYIDINFIQTGHLQKDSFLSGGVIDGSFSLSYETGKNNSIYFSYILGYEGAGAWRMERDIKERTIKQSVLIEDHFKINEFWRIRPQVYFGWQKFRESSISSYEYNIYNNNIKGTGVSVDFFREFSFTFYLNYRKVYYPNYTDLLSEITYNVYSVKTGMYDKNIFETGVRFKKNFWFAEINYLRYLYLNQKIISPNGSYLNKYQRDSEINFIITRGFEFRKVNIYPTLELKIYSSNQNYLRYKDLFDITPFFLADAYSYRDYSLKSFFNLNYRKSQINSSISYTTRMYDSRYPRDVNNDYILSQRQNQNFLVISAEIIKNITDYAYYKIGYFLTFSKSNNKFEFYIPYNYTSHTFYIGYGIRY